MLTKPQYSVGDWLDLHKLTSKEVMEYCDIIAAKYPPEVNYIKKYNDESGLNFVFDQSLEYLVLPCLKTLLQFPSSFDNILSSVKIVQHKPNEIELPYTEYCDDEDMPVIHMSWSGNAADLICLAHEMAHAAQMILSKGAFMPPIAREVCAFLGELALIQFARTQSDALYQSLCAVWYQENQLYLNNDAMALADNLEARLSLYRYCQNYPLARMAAIYLFATSKPKSLKDLFASGSFAMERLKLPEIFDDLSESNQTLTDVQHSMVIEGASLHLSLSPDALTVVATKQIDQTWLSQTASVGCVLNGNRIEGTGGIEPKTWIKWRSLGVLALAALQRGEADILPGEFLEVYEKSASQSPKQIVSISSPWVQPLKFDALTALGTIIQLLAASSYHRQFKLSDYLPVEILPPLRVGQLRCYLDANATPVGLATWAWLSDELKQNIHKTGRELQNQEWIDGSHLFFNDWIMERTVQRIAVTEMRDVIFPDHIGSSLRRTNDGSVRRINKWVGKNYRCCPI